jgi:excisionase family DNA binding protein
MSTETYMTPKEAAAYLRSSPSTLAKRRLAGGNSPPFTRIGAAIRYRKSDLDAWMAASVRRSTSDTSAQHHAA